MYVLWSCERLFSVHSQDAKVVQFDSIWSRLTWVGKERKKNIIKLGKWWCDKLLLIIQLKMKKTRQISEKKDIYMYEYIYKIKNENYFHGNLPENSVCRPSYACSNSEKQTKKRSEVGIIDEFQLNINTKYQVGRWEIQLLVSMDQKLSPLTIIVNPNDNHSHGSLIRGFNSRIWK